MKPIIELKSISKSYDHLQVIHKLDLGVLRNEFITLLGPSGCGKTTTLRIIGGFESPDEGTVHMDGLNITTVPPYKRNINTVFQRYALFPHLNVAENIAFGLKIQKLPKELIEQKVSQALKRVNLEGYEKRKTTQLSGGQQQRVAIARAIVNEPEVLLLDEPLGALDLKLRKEMQYELKDLQKTLGITFIYVTHDQEEALTMSDRVIVMNDGVIQQIGSPEDIYNEPANAFVADFIGESNIVTGTMVKDMLVKIGDVSVPCVDKGFLKDEIVDVVIRPEDVKFTTKENGLFTGVIDTTIFKGVHYEMAVLIDDTWWLIHSTKDKQPGETVHLTVTPENVHIMPKA